MEIRDKLSNKNLLLTTIKARIFVREFVTKLHLIGYFFELGQYLSDRFAPSLPTLQLIRVVLLQTEAFAEKL